MDLFDALAAKAAGDVPLLVPRTLSRYAGDVGMTATAITADGTAGGSSGDPATSRAHASAERALDSLPTPGTSSVAARDTAEDLADTSSTTPAPERSPLDARNQRRAREAAPRARDPVMDVGASIADANARADAVERLDDDVVASDDPVFAAVSADSPATPRTLQAASRRNIDDDTAPLRDGVLLTPTPPIALEPSVTSRTADVMRDEPMLVPRGPVPLQSLVPLFSSPTASQPQHSNAISTSNEQLVEVTIGRVEVRAVTPPAPQPQRRAAAEPQRLSLDEYLRRRPGSGA